MTRSMGFGVAVAMLTGVLFMLAHLYVFAASIGVAP